MFEEAARVPQAEVEGLLKSQPAAEEELLNPQRPRANVVGVGVGAKWSQGRPTGAGALVALVSQKLPKELVGPEDLVPAQIGGMRTDVLEVGELFAGVQAPTLSRAAYTPGLMEADGRVAPLRAEEAEAVQPAARALEVGALALTNRVRPAKGGYSVGHYRITAGTIATCVYDILPGGIGVPPRFYILSNNHVLANSNLAAPGDPILQPGPYDGGSLPADRIASLSRYISIMFEPPIPRFLHRNLVDAAIAEGRFHELDREVHWLGRPMAWRRRVAVPVGMRVQKVGRTTNLTFGRITAINATVDVNYGGGRIARFRDQIVTTNMSGPGDSGSLVVSALDSSVVGLLFAGSAVATICNQIENVRSLLKVEPADNMI